MSFYKGKEKVKVVIFDWAGTTVDYGCFAPMDVFIKVFKNYGINITIEEARKPMGLKKIDHIKALCKMERINDLWVKKYGRKPNEEDIKLLYKDFKEMLLKILPNYAEPIKGVVDVVNNLKKQNILIGSTTGYTKDMMDIVAKKAKEKGYEPDNIVTSSDVSKGRPFPYMCYKNALDLEVYPMKSIVKIGDTLSDIKEGLNSGLWSIGVIMGSSELGLSEKEVNDIDKDLLDEKIKKVKDKFLNIGAHYVIESINELTDVLKDINKRLDSGEFPSRKDEI